MRCLPIPIRAMKSAVEEFSVCGIGLNESYFGCG